MSGSKSPQLSPQPETKNDPARSSSENSVSIDSVPEKEIQASGVANSEMDNDKSGATVDQLASEEIDLTRKQTQWVFAATCYAFGVLKRDFGSLIDDELLALIKDKLNNEPGFHHDTLNFGNNHFHDKLELVVRQTWGIFLRSDKSLDILDEEHTHEGQYKIVDQSNNYSLDNHPSQRHQSITTSDDNNGAIERNKTTPNSSSGGDSASNDLQMIGGNNDAQVRKVYLGGLIDDIDEADLRDYFKDYGTIADINIVLHKDTGKRRGFAFVEYDDHEPVDKIVCKKFHTIKGRRIEAKKAIPKVEMDARKRVDQRVSLTDAMMVLRGSSAAAAAAYLWEGGLQCPGAAHAPPPPPLHAHPVPPPAGNHAYHNHLDHHHHHHHPHHHYSDHYHPSAAPVHYGGGGGAGAAGGAGGAAAASWLLHSASSRASANGYPSHHQALSNGAGWALDAAAVAAAAASGGGGGIGPIRSLSYGSQHARAYRPYATGGGGGSNGSANGGGRARNFK